MIIGVVKERKEQENRVAITPAGVDALTACGHKVLIEQGAGLGSGFSDQNYKAAGAEILKNASDVWTNSEMMVKVKEPHKSEYKFLRPGLVFFAYLHLAADYQLTKILMDSGIVSIAYETVQRSDRSLPLLTPMSEVVRMAIQEGLYVWKTQRKGYIIGRCAWRFPASVVVVGAGTVGICNKSNGPWSQSDRS